MNPAEKGRALEEAVSSIERLILESSPMYNEQTFRIEPRKIVIVDDVRHEIDLYVTCDLGPGYTSTFIFECKNWKERVGKNEIIIFSEKIAATRAQTGFFVARDFTRDAVAQASKDPRLQLRKASNVSSSLADLTQRLHFLLVHKIRIESTFTLRARDGHQVIPNSATAIIQTPSTDTSLEEYIRAVGADLSTKSLTTFPSAELAPGGYEITARGSVDALAGSKIDGIEILAINLEVVSSVEIARPAVVSQYEVDDRGRIVWLEPISYAQVALAAKLTAVPDCADPEKHHVSIRVNADDASQGIRLSGEAVNGAWQIRLTRW